MQSFPAANNLQIEADNYSWRLTAQSAPGVALVEAQSSGVTYLPAFARARRIPESGLAPEQIESVIVGWEADWWQLGFVFDGALEMERGRWCGVARWYDPTAAEGLEIAHTAGRLLAESIRRPFQFFPPAPKFTEDTVVVEQNQPRARLENVADLPLPIQVGEWMLTENRVGLAWERSAAWQRGILIQAVFFGGLALLILLLAAGGLRSLFAPVQPEWLPLAGILVTIAILIRAAYCVGLLITRGSLEFDERNRLIRVVRRPTGVIRQIPFEKIEYLLVSDVLSQHKPSRALPIGREEIIAGETWIHLRRQQGDFLQVAYIPMMDGRAAFDPRQHPGERHPLDIHHVESPAHHAALRISRMMNVPAWEELRWTPRNGVKPPPPKPAPVETISESTEDTTPQPEQTG